MDDVEAAKALIQNIRRAKRVDDVAEDENARDLENALKMLSEELYSKPTHFILELIQNADDNAYGKDVVPELSLYYTRGYHDDYDCLIVGCNELGFEPRHVQAICRIAGSTKKVEGSRKGYIGEKGIGFKAVFKVAAEVFVKSRALSFKFNKRRRLGMIAPEWANWPDDFPLEIPDEFATDFSTFFCFLIERPEDRQLVQEELRSLDKGLILFLRQIRKLKVTIEDCTDGVVADFTLQRDDGSRSGIAHTVLKRNVTAPRPFVEQEGFLVFHHTANAMPHEPNREGVDNSELVLALPVSEALLPVVRNNRLVYNFLPVRCYNLPFLLHCDFMLSANREDVLLNSKWNETLLHNTMEAFTKAVVDLSNKGILRFTWPQYVVAQYGTPGTIFANLIHSMKERLKSCSIILCQDNSYRIPASTQTVPDIFTDGTSARKPLLALHTGLEVYASASYQQQHLADLGVRQQSSADFRDVLKRFIRTQPYAFQRQSLTWHSRIANAILHAGPKHFRDVELIPLNDDTWASPNQKQAYFPDVGSGLSLPNGIELSTIAQEAANDATRSRLFSELGAKALDASEVCRLVLWHHKDSYSRGLAPYTLQQLISHARFLFGAPINHRNYDLSALRLADSNPHIWQAHDLYMNDPYGGFSIGNVYGNGNRVLNLLHPDYFEGLPDSSKLPWFDFLKQDVGVSTLPKLSRGGATELSPEFTWLIDNKASSVWLNLLRDHWEHYYPYAGFGRRIAGQDVAISNSLVDNSSMLRQRLCTVYLRTMVIATNTRGLRPVNFLEVSDPDHPDWAHFSRFGLGTTCDLRFYVAMLRSLRSAPVASDTRRNVKWVYEKIQHEMLGDSELVESLFNDGRTVFIARPLPGRWIHLGDCRWNSSQCLVSVVPLAGRYPELRDLFVGRLRVRDAGTQDVLDEMSRTGEIEKMKKLLKTLNDFIVSSALTFPEKASLLQLRIWPVRTGGFGLFSFRSLNDSTWFVADKRRLRQCFEGKLDLLDFTLDQMSDLGNIFAQTNMMTRMLSTKVTEETEATGELAYCPHFTDLLRSKATYIAPLVEQRRRRAVLQQLSTIEVRCAQTVALRRYALVNGSRLYGADDRGWLVIRQSGESLTVYVSQEAIADNSLPYRQLCDRLGDIIALSADKQAVLMTILVTSSTGQIEDYLERADLMPGSAAQVDVQAPTIRLTSPETEDLRIPQASPRTPVHQRGISDARSDSNGYDNAGGLNPFHSTPTRSPGSGDRNALTGPGSAGSSIINTSEIIAAATTFDTEHIDVATSPLSINRTVRAAVTAISNTPTAVYGDSAEPVDSFDMSGLRSALGSPSPLRVRSSGRATRIMVDDGSTPSASSTQTTAWQHEIGYGGELFIFKLLKHRFAAADSCWTSNMRARFGLDRFSGAEGAYSDFTVMDATVCNEITRWLIDTGCENASQWLDKPVTYHFEVKTTVGRREEPFMMSNNQLSLARQWHGSDTDVYVVLRVYDLVASPGVFAYVDPFALMLDGGLVFTAQGGYHVQPS